VKFTLRSIAHAALAVLLVLAAATQSPLYATNLTGTFKHPDGSPVNGKLIFLLSQPARLSDASAQIVPMVKIFGVTNGQVEAGAFVYGNDALLPSGTYYLVRLVDASNNLLFEQKWSIQGTDLDLGTLTPTTTGVVLPDPLLKNIPVDQSVEGPVTFNSPLTAFSLTLHGNLHPGLADVYNLGNTALPWRELSVGRLIAKGTPWFDVKAFGAEGDGNTNDTAAFQAAVAACATAGGGTVYVPPSPTEYLVPGPLTLTSPTGGWCTLLLGGDIALYDANNLNGQKITMQRRWAIAGWSFSKIAGQGTAMYDPVASIRGHQTNGPDTTIEVTGGPALISNIKITNVKQYGVNVVPLAGQKSNFKMINTNIAKSSLALGAAVRIQDMQDVIVRDSSFNITNAAGGDQSYAVEITQEAANLSLYTFDNVAVLGSGFLLQGQGGFEIGSMAFKSILFQNPVNKTALLQVVTKRNGSGVGVRGLSFLDVQAADPSGAAVNGVYLIENITTESGNEGIIEGVVIRNPAYFVKGFYKPSSTAGYTGAQEILGLSVHSTQEPSGTQPIGQFNRYSAMNRLGFRTGQMNIEGGAKLVVNMQRPTSVTATPFASGGALADGTYYYVVSALDADGNQTFISDEKSCVVSGGGGSGRCDLAWTASPGAVSYRIYGRGIALAYLNQQKPKYGTSTTTTFSDTAANLPNTANPPNYIQDVGNAAAFKFVSNAASWINNGSNFGIGTSAPGAPLDVVGKIRTTAQFESTQATGTAPLVVASNTEVANLNAQKWHGKNALDFSASLDFGSIAAQACAELTISATGAAANDPVAPAWPAGLEAGLAGIMRVSAADTVTVRLCNVTASAIDPADQTFAGRVIR
jgi:hypothetical protein